MSLLREVIDSVGEMEWTHFIKRIPILIRDTDMCRSEVFKTLDDFYLHYLQKPKKIPHLAEKLQAIQKELQDLCSNCEQWLIRESLCPKKDKNYHDILNQLRDTLKLCTEVKDCYFMNEYLIDLRIYENNCEKSTQLIEKIRYTFTNCDSQILKKYYSKHSKIMESTTFLRLGEVITNKFIFGVKNHNCIRFIEVKKNIDIGDSIYLLLKCFNHIKQLDDLIDFIEEFIMVPIVTCNVVMTTNDTTIQLRIIKNEKPHYSEVFTELREMTNFLLKNFNICIDKSLNNSLLDYIGSQLNKKTSTLIKKQCLQSLSGNSGDTKSFDYETFLIEVENLQNDLANIKFINDNSLLIYAQKLKRLRSLRSQDPIFNHIKTLINKSNFEIVKLKTNSNKMSDLPSMSISNVVQEIERILENIFKSPNLCKQQIDLILRICHYYRIHSTEVAKQSTPQKIALFHNNYIYMAYKLRHWNIHYSNIIFKDDTVPVFKNEAILFQTVGEEVLDTFLQKQKSRLSSWLNKLGDSETRESCEYFEITFRICLTEINSLIESWNDLLPITVFHKHIGEILNVICYSLIKLILKLENINEDLVRKISKIFDDILKLDKYFEGVADLKKFIICWNQFRALSFILKSDLKEIEINEYHKLYKANFEPFEVIKIFKALFKQSEREAVLSQLYN